ncbi:MAG: YbhB/YbcL family Raf kinase inhibitor-like protein [Deltaproteobacteria bacterium]|nr:MAG: YbhB/YbcL family Raf kinase inhibitor-like protein [Deltaproteobacteria bacterium]
MVLSSPAFKNKGNIPPKHTCQGENVSPPLEWRNLPEGTKSLVLIVDDPDAPDPKAPKMVWDHWVVYDIPATSKGLAEGAASKGLPKGARHGLNSWKKAGYGGPCPPIGTHRYFHKLYALDVVLGDLGKPTKKKLLEAIEGHVLGKAELVGLYKKK